jgi:hypothetical protein
MRWQEQSIAFLAGLGEMGEAAAPAIRDLMELAARFAGNDGLHPLYTSPVRVLASLGERARPALLNAIVSGAREERLVAADALVRIGVADDAATERMMSLQQDKSPLGRMIVARCLGAVGAHGSPHQVRLRALLEDRNWRVAAAAAKSIGKTAGRGRYSTTREHPRSSFCQTVGSVCLDQASQQTGAPAPAPVFPAG